MTDANETTPQTFVPTRPVYWSLQRELWENRSIVVAPAAVAAMVQFGYLIFTFHLRRHIDEILALTAVQKSLRISGPYQMAAGFIVITAAIVGFFYCLDALYGERQDRSILFWKSLPVSDRTAVLTKAAVPLLVLPSIAFVLVVVTQSLMMVASTVALLGKPQTIGPIWSELRFVQSWIAVLYGAIVMTAWLAPIHAWLLFVSSWAKRAAFLWAVLPGLAIAMLEKIAFNTQYFGNFLGWRVTGWYQLAFIHRPKGSKSFDPNPLAHLTPGRFFGAPGLWLGLLVAAAFLAAAVWMRRSRQPL